MDYLIKRGDAQYGPYSLAGLQQYLQSGHLSKDDLARSEGMADWVPLWQVLGSVPVPPPAQAAPVYPAAAGYATPGYGVPSAAAYGAAPAPAQYPVAPQTGLVELPPNLPWWVMLIGAFIPGVSLLILVWVFVLAAWAKKLSGKSTALVCFILYFVGLVCAGIAIGVGGSLANNNGNDASVGGAVALVGFLLMMGAAVLAIVGAFSIRSAMEDYYNKVENIGLKLSGVMTFFFNVLYFQYHVNQLHERKKGYMQTPYAR